jgi:hypothetical protein
VTKFNNPNGTPEQQICHSTCGIYDASTGNNERKNRDGVPIDIEYTVVDDRLSLTQWMDKCKACAFWQTFKDEMES